MDLNSAFQRNELFICATVWLNLKSYADQKKINTKEYAFHDALKKISNYSKIIISVDSR